MSSTGTEGATAVNVASNIGVQSYVGASNPITGDGAPLRPSTASLTSIIRYALTQHEKNQRIVMPAVVEAVTDDYYVDVRLGFMMRFRNEREARELPKISQVPVVMPQGGSYALRLPIAKGDTGLVIVLDRSINTWLAGDGSPADPKSQNIRQLCDAIFIPGFLTEAATEKAGVTNGNLQLQNKGASLTLKPNGGVSLGNSGGEVVDVLSQITAALVAVAALVPATVPGIDTLQKALLKLKG